MTIVHPSPSAAAIAALVLLACNTSPYYEGRGGAPQCALAQQPTAPPPPPPLPPTEWGLHTILVWSLEGTTRSHDSAVVWASDLAETGVSILIRRDGSPENTLVEPAAATATDVVAVELVGEAPPSPLSPTGGGRVSQATPAPTAPSPNRHGLAWALGEQRMESLVRFEYVDADTARVVVGPVPGYALEEPETVRVSLNAARVTSLRSAALVSLWSKEDAVERDIEIRVRPTPDAIRAMEPDALVGATEVQLMSLPLSGSTAAEIQQLKLYFALACEGADADGLLDLRHLRSFHPLGFLAGLESVAGSQCLAALLGNTLFLTLVTLVHYTATVVSSKQRTLRRRLCDWRQQGNLLFPSVPLCVFSFLFVGNVACAARLAGGGDVGRGAGAGAAASGLSRAGQTAVGVGALASLAASAAFAAAAARRVAASGAAVYRVDQAVLPLADAAGWRVRWPSVVAAFLFGTGEWVGGRANTRAAGRHYVQLRPFRSRYPWWSAVDAAVAFAAAGALGLGRGGHRACAWGRVVCASVAFAHAASVTLARPYARGRDNLLMSVRALMVGLGLAIASVASFREDPRHPGLLTAARMLYASLFVSLAKVVLDGVCFLVTGVCLRRRARLEKELWGVSDGQVPQAPTLADLLAGKSTKRWKRRNRRRRLSKKRARAQATALAMAEAEAGAAASASAGSEDGVVVGVEMETRPTLSSAGSEGEEVFSSHARGSVGLGVMHRARSQSSAADSQLTGVAGISSLWSAVLPPKRVAGERRPTCCLSVGSCSVNSGAGFFSSPKHRRGSVASAVPQHAAPPQMKQHQRGTSWPISPSVVSVTPPPTLSYMPLHAGGVHRSVTPDSTVVRC